MLSKLLVLPSKCELKDDIARVPSSICEIKMNYQPTRLNLHVFVSNNLLLKIPYFSRGEACINKNINIINIKLKNIRKTDHN